MARITKSQLSRELGVSKSRVSQLVHDGLPVQPDGRLDRLEALTWILETCTSQGSGWDTLRGKTDIAGRAAELLAPSEQRYTRADITDAIRHGIEYALNKLLEPVNVRQVADAALVMGADTRLAWGLAEWYRMFVVFTYIPKDPERRWIADEEPDWGAAFFAANGLEFDRAELLNWWNRQLKQVNPCKS